MIEAMRLWLLSVLGISLLCALADALMPKGAVKKVGKLACGLVLMITVISPLVHVDLEQGVQWLDGYAGGIANREQELKDQVDDGMKTIIAQQYEAYIVDKAAQLGVICTAQVTCRQGEEGVFLPAQVQITGSFSQQRQEELSAVLEQELGLSPECQQYTNEEEMP